MTSEHELAKMGADALIYGLPGKRHKKSWTLAQAREEAAIVIAAVADAIAADERDRLLADIETLDVWPDAGGADYLLRDDVLGLVEGTLPSSREEYANARVAAALTRAARAIFDTRMAFTVISDLPSDGPVAKAFQDAEQIVRDLMPSPPKSVFPAEAGAATVPLWEDEQ